MPVPFRLAILPDFPEERWPSMDLCAEMQTRHLPEELGNDWRVERCCPSYRKLFGNIPFFGRRRLAHNLDRLLNRFRVYPRYLARRRSDFVFFHVVDHTYSQLVHCVPPARTGVYCHDLDAYRSILEPHRDPRPRWFRNLARKSLDGLQKAAVIFYSTDTIRMEYQRLTSIDTSNWVLAPYGVADDFTPEAASPSDLFAAELGTEPYVLHVGSCIPRKRIDVLLRVFAEIAHLHPALRLLQVGGAWTLEQQQLIDTLGVRAKLRQTHGVSRAFLAAAYRRAALVLQTSEAEGFGLPLIEALACGAPVMASEIPVLREVGETAVVYCPVADVPAWSESVDRYLKQPDLLPARSLRLARAQQFTWANQARIIAAAYQRLAGTIALPSSHPNASIP